MTTFTHETIDRMLGGLRGVDECIDAAQAGVANQSVADTLAGVAGAEELKRHVILLCPQALVDVYDLFYFFDLAAATGTAYGHGDVIVDKMTLRQVLEILEQAMAELQRLLEEDLYHGKQKRLLIDMIGWIADLLEVLRKAPIPFNERPDALEPGELKRQFLLILDKSGDLNRLFDALEGLNRDLYCVRRCMQFKPPNFKLAGGHLEVAE